MKLILILCFLLASCGDFGPQYQERVTHIPGKAGANCYDHLGDINNDGSIDTKDCVGPAGVDGKDGVAGKDGLDGKDGVAGKVGLDGKDGTDGKDFTPAISLEGYYVFPNGGVLELIEDADGRIIIYGTQRLYTVNFDSGLALHPNLPSGPHILKGGILRGEYSPTYSSTTNDVEVDGQQSTNISGKRKTVYKIWLTKSGKLKVQLMVYSSSGLQLEVNRTIKGD